MYFDDTEYRYAQQRVVQSLRMARAAADCCARAAHENLATRYAMRLESLIEKREAQGVAWISPDPQRSPLAATLAGLISSLALPPMIQQPR